MHSPVAHVLYLCHPEMKHLCGDGFFTASFNKVLKRNMRTHNFLVCQTTRGVEKRGGRIK